MNEERKIQPELAVEERSAELVMLDQQLALGAYLNALLRPPADPPETPVATPAPPVAKAVVETAVKEPAPRVEAAVTPAPAVAPESRSAASPYPDWAEGQFQCLLFRVAGVALALPLAKLNGVLPWDDEAVTEMPNHQPWFLGLREHLGRKVKLIDVANIVLPPDRFSELPAADSHRLGKIVLIGDGRWGLAVDDVAEVVTLSIDAVKWRSQAGNRPWLAGTVIKQMCALIDMDAFAAMLERTGPERG